MINNLIIDIDKSLVLFIVIIYLQTVTAEDIGIVIIW